MVWESVRAQAANHSSQVAGGSGGGGWTSHPGLTVLDSTLKQGQTVITWTFSHCEFIHGIEFLFCICDIMSKKITQTQCCFWFLTKITLLQNILYLFCAMFLIIVGEDHTWSFLKICGTRSFFHNLSWPSHYECCWPFWRDISLTKYDHPRPPLPIVPHEDHPFYLDGNADHFLGRRSDIISHRVTQQIKRLFG